MDTSIFTDREIVPADNDLMEALGDSYVFWKEIREYVLQKHPKAMEEWKHWGIKYGWGFRIKDKKRAIIYLGPGDKYFRVSMIFGQKAKDEIMHSDICNEIKELLAVAVVYVEGTGIRFVVKDDRMLKDIKKLIDIKLS